MKVLDLVYLQKLHHIVEQEPAVKYITEHHAKNKVSVSRYSKVIARMENQTKHTDSMKTLPSRIRGR